MKTRDEKMKVALSYVARIRNQAKRIHAENMEKYFENGVSAPYPQRPKALSFMGAQAVEIDLANIWGISH